jgi:hypothetical protein
MQKLYSCTLALGLLIALGSCKKDEQKPNGPTLSAKEQLLVAHKWRISAITLVATTPFGSTTSDGYARLQTCQKDNFLEYKTDKTAVEDEGATKCSNNAPQNNSFNWSLNTAETQLTHSGTINGQASSVAADLLQLTSTSMQIRTTTTQTSGGITFTTEATTTYVTF